jgi:hypothetical protein
MTQDEVNRLLKKPEKPTLSGDDLAKRVAELDRKLINTFTPTVKRRDSIGKRPWK